MFILFPSISQLVQEELRPYFPLPKVMEGLFNLTKKLFGVDIEPADGTAPVKLLKAFETYFLLMAAEHFMHYNLIGME